MFEGKFFHFAYSILLFLLIIFLAEKVSFFLKPLGTVLSFIMLPLLIGGFLYYLLRPVVRLISSKIKNKSFSIILTFFILIFVMGSIFYFGGNIVYIEIKKLINYFYQNYSLSAQNLNRIAELNSKHLKFLSQLNLKEKLVYMVQELLKKITSYNIIGIFSSLKNLGVIIILIPFILFYLLKDEELAYDSIMKLVPTKNRGRFEKMLKEIDQVLAAYINTQLMVALILGVLMLAGYLVIKIPNAFALALIATITSIIPILGPILGTIPAIFVAISVNTFMLIKLLGVIVVAQYLEGNIVRPFVQGEKLSIHPVIVILVVLSSITLFGVLGALFAVPAYASIRIAIKHLKEKNFE